MTITEADVHTAIQAWSDALVAISKTHEDESVDAARALADSLIDKLYGYSTAPVLFKPTMASGEQTFRPTKAGAVSYFVSGNDDFPLDGGFALKGWRKVEAEETGIVISGDAAMWMGWIIITDKHGDVTTVDKSFGYLRDEAGDLRIVLHHSSFPYSP